VGNYPESEKAMPQIDARLAGRPHRRRRVEDVMTAAVVTVDPLTPYKEIARLLSEYRVSALPVLAEGWQVIGVVSETDLLAARDSAARREWEASPRLRAQGSWPGTLSACDLMTAPPVTIRPAATISAAIRVMTSHHVTSLPVTGAERQLIGIVSRRDLLGVFLRPDVDIIGDVRDVIEMIPFRPPADITVTVRHGVVTLAGVVRAGPDRACGPDRPRDLVRAAMRQIWGVDGVVDVVNNLGEATAKLA
jgi:CBS domain-containing protein